MRGYDLTGERFGRLTVIELIGRDEFSHKLWRCKCDCGNEKVVTTSSLTQKHTTSCGCYYHEYMSATKSTHRMSETKLFKVYTQMKKRCFNEKDKSYPYYGARGIGVCSEWVDNPQSFFTWALSNGYEEGLTLDRINTNGDYEPDNCRWVTRTEQMRNIRNNIRCDYKGENLTLAEIAERTNIKYMTLYHRYRKTGDIELCIF